MWVSYLQNIEAAYINYMKVEIMKLVRQEWEKCNKWVNYLKSE